MASKKAAIVGIQDKGNKEAKMQDSATGSGSIEAICNTINRIMEQEIILKKYNIEAITGGKRCASRVHVVVEMRTARAITEQVSTSTF